MTRSIRFDDKGTLGGLSLQGLFWGSKGAIALGEKRRTEVAFENNLVALTGLSIIYYNAAINASARGREQGFSMTWAWTAFRCFHKALRLSNSMEREYGLVTMTADQLLVRATILLKSWKYKKYSKAISCFKSGLEKAQIDKNIGLPTHALLLIGLAKLGARSRTEMSAKEIVGLISKAVGLVTSWGAQEPAEASRVFYEAVEVLETLGHKSAVLAGYRETAETLAKRANGDSEFLKHGLLFP